MTLDEIVEAAIEPAFNHLPFKMDTPEARVMLLAIGLQESEFLHRYQELDTPGKKGPARGFWQFEAGGGVRGVMEHPASTALARAAVQRASLPWDRLRIWAALETNDELAATFARLLLWTDAGKLPALSQPDEAWQLYARTWRPGKPHPEKWPANHRKAVGYVMLP